MQWIEKFTKPIFLVRIRGCLSEKSAIALQNDLLRVRILQPAALAVVINSNGGTAAQSHLMFNKIRNFAESKGNIPVYTFAEDFCLSGGYELLCAGDEAYCLSTSLVGSIGSRSYWVGLQDFIKKQKIERRLVASSQNLPEVLLDPFTQLSGEGEKFLNQACTHSSEHFKNLVKQRRGNKLKITSEKGEQTLFQAEIYTGTQAVEIGQELIYSLVDGIGTVKQIMKEKFGDRKILNLTVPSFREKIFNR